MLESTTQYNRTTNSKQVDKNSLPKLQLKSQKFSTQNYPVYYFIPGLCYAAKPLSWVRRSNLEDWINKKPLFCVCLVKKWRQQDKGLCLRTLLAPEMKIVGGANCWSSTWLYNNCKCYFEIDYYDYFFSIKRNVTLSIVLTSK